MSRSEKKRARRLRWRLMQSLTVTFVLLWLGTMVLFTSNTCSDMESGAKTAARAAQTSVDEHYEFYTNNIASGLGEQANHILSGNLSSLSLGQAVKWTGAWHLLCGRYTVMSAASYHGAGAIKKEPTWANDGIFPSMKALTIRVKSLWLTGLLQIGMVGITPSILMNIEIVTLAVSRV